MFKNAIYAAYMQIEPHSHAFYVEISVPGTFRLLPVRLDSVGVGFSERLEHLWIKIRAGAAAAAAGSDGELAEEE